MADVRGAAGVPTSAVFTALNSPTPSTPLYVNTSNGDLYVLVGSTVQRVAGAGVTNTATATGTNQATAYSLTDSLTVFTTVAAGTGAILSAGPVQTVFNGGANVLKIYPPTSARINNLANNASMNLATNTACTFYYVSSTQWIGVLSA